MSNEIEFVGAAVGITSEGMLPVTSEDAGLATRSTDIGDKDSENPTEITSKSADEMNGVEQLLAVVFADPKAVYHDFALYRAGTAAAP